MPDDGGFEVPEVGEYYEPPPDKGLDGAPTAGVPAGQAQEFSAGPGHWLAVFGVLVGVWWLFSRFSSGGKTTSGGSRNAAGRAGPDAEELRRKRLEALGAANRAAGQSGKEQEAVSSEVDSGLRRRAAAAVSKDKVVEKASTEPGLRQVLPEKVEEISAAETSSAPAVELSTAEPRREEVAAPVNNSTEVASGNVACDTPAETETSVNCDSSHAGPQTVETPAVPEVTAEVPVQEVLAEAIEGTPAEPEKFTVRVQGNLRGLSSSRMLQFLTVSTLVSELIDSVASAFEISSSEGIRIRLFFKQKELKNTEMQLGDVGISAGCNLQAIFARSAEPVAATAAGEVQEKLPKPLAPRSSSSFTAAAELKIVSAALEKHEQDDSPPFSVRAQGTPPGGAPAAHVVEGLRGFMSVIDLEGHIAAAFATGNSTRLRLFYMGRELKDGDATLRATGMQAGATVQVMFAAGEPRHHVHTPASAVDAGSSVSPQVVQAVAAEAAAVEAASGTPTEAVQDAAASTPASPAEAWQSLAALEQQLSRANDESEAPPVRQAALMLKSMLTTLTHGSNPALLQTAQAMVPDLKHIWAFDPTREHLCYLLNPSGFTQDAAFHSSSASGTASSTAPADS